VDPHGRAILVGAVERFLIVFPIDTDDSDALAFRSPLELSESSRLFVSMCGIDTAFEHPTFACLTYALDDDDGDRRPELIFYQLDLSLNVLVRLQRVRVDPQFYRVLIAPPTLHKCTGVLLCADDRLQFFAANQRAESTAPVLVPRRRPTFEASESRLVTASTFHRQSAHSFFWLLHTEAGDVLKVERDPRRAGTLRVAYFDTLPAPATHLLILKYSGMFFAPSAASRHRLFQLTRLDVDVSGGDDDDEQNANSVRYYSARGGGGKSDTADDSSDSESDDEAAASARLEHMRTVLSMENVNCVSAAMVDGDLWMAHSDLARNENARLVRKRYGYAAKLVVESPLGHTPRAVFSLKRRRLDTAHRYVLIAFDASTLVLSVGDMVEECAEHPFDGDAHTLLACNLGDELCVQVMRTAVRSVNAHDQLAVMSIDSIASDARCVLASTNGGQLALLLDVGDGAMCVAVLDFDSLGQLRVVRRVAIDERVVDVALPALPVGQRARFVVVALASSSLVQVLSLDNDDADVLSFVSLPRAAVSLCCFARYLYVALQDGVLWRLALDIGTGKLSATHRRFVMPTATLRVTRVLIGQAADELLVASSTNASMFVSPEPARLSALAPLSGAALDSIAPLQSGAIAERAAFVGVCAARRTFAIVGIDVHSRSVWTAVDERASLRLPSPSIPSTLLCDVPAATERRRRHRRSGARKLFVVARQSGGARLVSPLARGGGSGNQDDRALPPPPSVADDDDDDDDDAEPRRHSVLSALLTTDGGRIVLGMREGFAHVYSRRDGALVHVTATLNNEPVLSLAEYNRARIIAGTTRHLIMYEMGQSQLLLKCYLSDFPSGLRFAHVWHTRIFVGDLLHSFFAVEYCPIDNRLCLLADDPTPRHLTASALIDANTVLGADKFGNVFALAVPLELATQLQADSTGAFLQQLSAPVASVATLLSSSSAAAATSGGGVVTASIAMLEPHKLKCLFHMHIGQVVTSLGLCRLLPSSPHVVLYTTILGAIGVLVPLSSSADVDLLQSLQLHLRPLVATLGGHSHVSFRSSSEPTHHMIDGDLCSRFASAPRAVQEQLAAQLAVSPALILKKLDSLLHF
jgi:splicing factor 3B subunit 3